MVAWSNGMNAMVATWLFLRALRWLLWITFFVFSFYVRVNRATIVTSLNQLPQGIELLMYSLGVAAVFAGFFELMIRERTGLPRPPFGRIALPRT